MAQSQGHMQPAKIPILLIMGGALLLAACASGEAKPAPTTTPEGGPPPRPGAPPSATPAATPTAIPRRTPNPDGNDGLPGLIAVKTTVHVSNGRLTIADSVMEAEEVYFDVWFDGEDEEHQVSVVRWPGDPAALPVDWATDQVITGGDLMYATEPATSGGYELFEIDPIAPGRYVILCNLPGHYRSGEFAGFEVVSPPPGAPR